MKMVLGNDKNKEPSNYFGTLQMTCRLSALVPGTDTKASEVNALGENKDKVAKRTKLERAISINITTTTPS